jgi:hypothetical protein
MLGMVLRGSCGIDDVCARIKQTKKKGVSQQDAQGNVGPPIKSAYLSPAAWLGKLLNKSGCFGRGDSLK